MASASTSRTVLLGGGASSRLISSAIRTVVAHRLCSWRKAKNASGPPQSFGGAVRAPPLHHG
jgi:hypothetical protein